MPVCALIAQRSVLIQPCDLRLITTEHVDVKCAAFELVNMRSGENCLRLDLLDCEDILLCCSGGTDLVFFGLSGCTWLTIQDSRHFSNFCDRLAVQRSLAERLASRSRPTLVFLTEWLETFFLFEFGCSKRVFEVKLPISFFPRVCRDTILCRLIFVGDLWRDKNGHLVIAPLRNGDFVSFVKFNWAS